MELCMAYLTYPSYNVNQSARAQELARRGEDCSRYAGAAAAQRQNDAIFENMLRSLSAPTQPNQQVSPIYQQGTHTYVINGRTVTCTTTGTVTNCF